jgi:hypothetical protein
MSGFSVMVTIWRRVGIGVVTVRDVPEIEQSSW